METESELKNIVLNAVSKQDGAFRLLYELLVDKIYGYVAYRVKTENDALDITQEIFIDLYQALPKFTYESDPQFYGFLFTITKRKLAKVYTRQSRQNILSDEEFNLENIPDVEINVAEQDEVRRALNKLDAETREIVTLHHWSRYTFKEIATMLSLKESNVRVRHHRALKTLSAFVETKT